jgi:5-methyltetrahydropteroyltriglutamate--homocysteine methyltransferase
VTPLLRSANHSSFPSVGETPLDQQIRTTRRRFERGLATADEVDRVVDEGITIAVAEQSRAFVDIVTDGLARRDGPTSYLARHLEGLETGPLVRWFDTNFYERRLEVIGPVRRVRPFLVRDFEVAAEVAVRQVVKPVLIGPVTVARLARDHHYRSLDALVDSLATALAEEVAALAAAGARCFQVDEPLLASHPDDVDRVRRTASRIFDAAGPGATTILSTYFGDVLPLAERLGELPGTHLGIDLAPGGTPLELLDRLPIGRGVALGLFDARTTRLEDASDVAARLEPYRASLLARDVIVGPNAGLEPMPRDQAFDKLLHARYLVEKLSGEWPWPS